MWLLMISNTLFIESSATSSISSYTSMARSLSCFMKKPVLTFCVTYKQHSQLNKYKRNFFKFSFTLFSHF